LSPSCLRKKIITPAFLALEMNRNIRTEPQRIQAPLNICNGAACNPNTFDPKISRIAQNRPL
jgi:hypothetical protein